MMASCRSICQTTCVTVKGEENINSEVLLHHRPPGKGHKKVVLEKSSLKKEPEEMIMGWGDMLYNHQTTKRSSRFGRWARGILIAEK